jgi:hypothetical protein
MLLDAAVFVPMKLLERVVAELLMLPPLISNVNPVRAFRTYVPSIPFADTSPDTSISTTGVGRRTPILLLESVIPPMEFDVVAVVVTLPVTARVVPSKVRLVCAWATPEDVPVAVRTRFAVAL